MDDWKNRDHALWHFRHVAQGNAHLLPKITANDEQVTLWYYMPVGCGVRLPIAYYEWNSLKDHSCFNSSEDRASPITHQQILVESFGIRGYFEWYGRVLKCRYAGWRLSKPRWTRSLRGFNSDVVQPTYGRFLHKLERLKLAYKLIFKYKGSFGYMRDAGGIHLDVCGDDYKWLCKARNVWDTLFKKPNYSDSWCTHVRNHILGIEGNPTVANSFWDHPNMDLYAPSPPRTPAFKGTYKEYFRFGATLWCGANCTDGVPGYVYIHCYKPYFHFGIWLKKWPGKYYHNTGWRSTQFEMANNRIRMLR